ncbi:MAG: NAD(P)/FAD-dependent oxidoreductase [Pseudomonadota bacterium]
MAKGWAGSGIARRAVLRRAGGAALVAAGAPLVWAGRAQAQSARGKRAVVLGGGFAGSAVAAELRRLAPAVEVVLVEPAADFFPATASLDVAFGRRRMADVVRGYGPLAARGVRLARGEGRVVDRARRVAETTAGSFAYDALVLATGIRLAPEEIEGLAADPAANATLYDRAGVVELAGRMAAFAGGTVVISVPAGALKCPPAPYEFALLMASRMKERKLKGKIVLLDAWPMPQPGPLGEALAAALSAHGDRIDYVAQTTVRSLDAAARKVVSDSGEEFAYDLLSLIPPNRATRLIVDLGLADEGDAFAAVDPVTLRTRHDAHVFAVGDAARTPFGKSAAAAAGMARNCAREIARALGVTGLASFTAAAPARVDASCYPYVDPERALKLEVAYAVSQEAASLGHDSRVLSDAEAKAANAAERRAWESALIDGIFGG